MEVGFVESRFHGREIGLERKGENRVSRWESALPSLREEGRDGGVSHGFLQVQRPGSRERIIRRWKLKFDGRSGERATAEQGSSSQTESCIKRLTAQRRLVPNLCNFFFLILIKRITHLTVPKQIDMYLANV